MAAFVRISPDGHETVRVRRDDVVTVAAVPSRSPFGPATHVTVDPDGFARRTLRFRFDDDSAMFAHADRLATDLGL